MSVDLIRLVDSIHRDKNIPKDILFEGIETALATAARKHYPNAEDIQVTIDPASGSTTVVADGEVVVPPDFGRIAAQTAKQVIIQKFREAERDSLFEEFEELRGELVTGTVQRFEGGAVTVNLGKTDALLPRSEQIPGESHHPGERVRAIILEVRKVGQRVKIILSRTHKDFVRRLFELEIPEIADSIIQIREIAREAGYRSKVAVGSIDTKVDPVGACVGVRGTRIKNIVDELGGERIDIVRWNESLQGLIPNALQPAEIEEVMLCQLPGRAIVLVREDQLSLAIGRRGQNVRLASKLVGCDIEIMTNEELNEVIERAVADFRRIDGVDDELAERLVEQGILSFDDLSVMELDDLVNTIEGMTEELAQAIVEQAEKFAEEEQSEDVFRRKSQLRGAAAAASEPEAGDGSQAEELAEALPRDEDSAEAADTRGMDSTTSEFDALFDASQSSALQDPGEAETPPTNEDLDAEDLRDLALAAEEAAGGLASHEVTHAPGEEDQRETERIVTEAVETGDDNETESSDTEETDETG
jgi:N utilization substance protein A